MKPICAISTRKVGIIGLASLVTYFLCLYFFTFTFEKTGEDHSSLLAVKGKVLVLNSHDGIQSQLFSVMRLAAPGLKLERNEGVGDYRVTRELSDKWWENNMQLCDPLRYRFIIVGDTAALVRPFLEHKCSLPIILYLSNRFDYKMETEEFKDFRKLMKEGCYRSNVRCTQNNLVENRYAYYVRNVDLKVKDYLPGVGYSSPYYDELWKNRTLILPPANNEDIFAYLASPAMNHLLDRLKRFNVTFPTIPKRGYGGPFALRHRILLHVPHDPNTNSLFENIEQGVIYIIPSKSLMMKWNREDEATRMNLPLEFLDEEFYNKYFDFYREHVRDLFFHFEKEEDLIPGSEFRKKVSEKLEAVRIQGRNFINYQQIMTMRTWRKLIDWAVFYNQ